MHIYPAKQCLRVLRLHVAQTQGMQTALDMEQHLFVRGPAREQHPTEERLDVLQLRVRRRTLQGLCCAELGVQRLRLITRTERSSEVPRKRSLGHYSCRPDAASAGLSTR